MHGFIANTDYDWFRFLRTRAELDEVNFWQPGGSRDFRRIPPGAPFFFKLKKPHYAIGGFGFFAHASRLPVSLAWDAFGEKNGAPNVELLLGKIVGYRKGHGTADRVEPDPTIGCIMVSDPVFFSDEQWIEQPRDWKLHQQQGEVYDLSSGEGLRVWEECLIRAAAATAPVETRTRIAEFREGQRYGRPVQVRPRLGQGTFRTAILDAYGRACAVTTEHSLPVLESAHIRPYARSGKHEYGNGILLRVDIHRLFELGFVSVDPDLRFRVSRRLRDEWKNGATYYERDGQLIHVPKHPDLQPDKRLLQWHYEEVFRN